jgi:hypothetical protein
MNIFYQFDNVQIDRDSICKEALLPFAGKIIELIIEFQHHKGVDGYGVDFNQGKAFSSPRFGAYSTSHARPRSKQGLQTDIKDFHFTGQFHEAVVCKFQETGVDVFSEDSKDKYIEGTYGKKIFKMSDENLGKLLSSGVRESVIAKFRQRIYKNG